MLGVNLIFAGFALTLNGLSFLIPVDEKAKGIANLLVGVIIGINAVFQTASATDFITYGFAAAMWLFALNYFIIGAHIFLNSTNWKVFAIYGLFSAVVSVIFGLDTLLNEGPWEMVYMWFMWAVLWAQTFVGGGLEVKKIDQLSPHILILNGLLSTFIPGILILLGIIL